MIQSIAKLVLLVATAQAAHNILDYGAVAEDDSYHSELLNSRAFEKALKAANRTDAREEREVIVPENMTFHMMAVPE